MLIEQHQGPSHDEVARLRWPDGVRCPTCGRGDAIFIATRRIWSCRAKHPRRQFSVRCGTVFEDSAIPIEKWMAAIWIVANEPKNATSRGLAAEIGVTQKTAWSMLHRIRLAMLTPTFQDSLEPSGPMVIRIPQPEEAPAVS